MNARLPVLLVLFALAWSLYVAGQSSGDTMPSSSAPSSAYIRQSDGAYVTDNRIFEFANVLRDDGGGYIRLLLLKEVQNEHIDGHEDTTGQMTVQAWTFGKDGTRSERWRFTAEGNDGYALSFSRFFRLTQWGCCDWPDVHWYFSLLSGKKLYVSNSDISDLTEIIVLDGGAQAARYVAFGWYKHQTPPVLQYGTDTQVKQQFSLVSSRLCSDRPQIFVTVGKKPEKSLSLAPNEPLNFTILLIYADGTELHIPVRDDMIRREEAKLPRGFTLRSEAVGDW
jgi:hypothetical protein